MGDDSGVTTGSVGQLRTPLALVASGGESSKGRRSTIRPPPTRLWRHSPSNTSAQPFLNMTLEQGLSVEKEMNSVFAFFKRFWHQFLILPSCWSFSGLADIILQIVFWLPARESINFVFLKYKWWQQLAQRSPGAISPWCLVPWCLIPWCRASKRGETTLVPGTTSLKHWSFTVRELYSTAL